MNPTLARDLETLPELLAAARRYATHFLTTLDERPAAADLPAALPVRPVPERGMGAEAVLRFFREHHDDGLSGSAGPRYLGFVTGGTTPAALLADWLVGTFDQNAQWNGDTVSPHLEHEALSWLAEVLGIPQGFDGICVTGATMANFVGLACGRQWLGEARGVDVSTAGLAAMPPIRVLGGAPHSSVYKALSMLGIGAGAVETVPLLPGGEGLDPEALGRRLDALAGEPVMVVANAGAVNNGDFDDLRALGTLRRQHAFWLHVDGAFGLVAAASPRYRERVAGLEHADSITVDGHKWLNVPYDGGYSYTKHLAPRLRVFRNASPYLPAPLPDPRNVLHLGPENSRRWRALPLWFTLLAYGREGICDIVERNCDLAQALGEAIEALDGYRLAAPVKLNVTCFEADAAADMEGMRRLQRALVESGEVYATPSLFQGRPVMRMAFCNWRTDHEDVARIVTALAAVHEDRLAGGS